MVKKYLENTLNVQSPLANPRTLCTQQNCVIKRELVAISTILALFYDAADKIKFKDFPGFNHLFT